MSEGAFLTMIKGYVQSRCNQKNNCQRMIQFYLQNMNSQDFQLSKELSIVKFTKKLFELQLKFAV